MARDNCKDEVSHEDEHSASIGMIYDFLYGDHSESNTFQEKSGAHLNSRPEDVTKHSDHKKLDEERDEACSRMTKRQRDKEYHVMMERKRRQKINDKVDILHVMTPNSSKTDQAGKLDEIISHIKSLEFQVDIMSKAYRATQVYTSPVGGAQPPCMSPWGYYVPGIPVMPQQYMPYIPQYDPVHHMAPRDQTKP